MSIMADGDDSVKSSNKHIENESFNDRNSFSGGSGNHGSTSACKFQPVRVKALLDMYENDDDDEDDDNGDDDNDNDSSDNSDNRALSDINEDQPLPLDNDNLKSMDNIEQTDIVSSNSLVNERECGELKREIVTEEPERQSSSHDLMHNVPSYFTYSSVNSISTTIVTTTVTMTTTTTSTIIPTNIASNFTHQLYDKNKQIQSYMHDNKRTSLSKELLHNTNDRKLSMGRSSITGFTSDFGAMDLDIKSIKAIGNSSDSVIPFVQCHPVVSNTAQLSSRCQTYDSGGQKIETNISSSSMYGNRNQSNVKFETVDLMHPSHDKHVHILTNYKSDPVVSTLNSKYDGPIPTSQSDILPTSSNYLPVNTPHKQNTVPGSMRPTSSTSHRNIFQTPQNKMPGDFSLNQSPAPTPGTIFSHWSQNNLMHTSMQNKISDSTQTPGKSLLSNLAWYKSKPTKSVRRPLAETTCSERRLLNEKPLQEFKIHDPEENSNHPPQERIQKKVTSSSAMTKESKENKLPLILESVTKSNELYQRNKISESIQENRHGSQEMIPKSMPIEVEPLHEHHNNPAVRQSTPIIQASVPSSIRKPEHGKIMKVKDREYMILGYLGQGMSGEVVRVQDLTNLELRAIKCVDLSRMDKDSAQSCVQEITMLGKLQAPCIVRMFDYEIRNKTIYVVMEMGDTDLSKFLKSICAEKQLPLTMIVYYWTEMLTAVKHIHDNGVIHSDLKPANFLLVRGRLKLIDFGIASSLNADMTSIVKNSTVGTLNYISPEALMDVGESPNHNSKYKISYKSDVWSLGCILYSLVFGHTPFQHIRQQWAKINAIVNPTSKILFTQPPNSEPIPSILIDVVRKCLQHDPKALPSVTDLLKIRYVAIGKQNTPSPNIPSTILLKIKHSLNDDEWRQFTEIMDYDRRNC